MYIHIAGNTFYRRPVNVDTKDAAVLFAHSIINNLIPVVITIHLQRVLLHQCLVLAAVHTNAVRVFVLARAKYGRSVFIHRLFQPVNAGVGGGREGVNNPFAVFPFVENMNGIIEAVRLCSSIAHTHDIELTGAGDYCIAFIFYCVH
jgi:hypothetical protein